jgi:hypothetical protein
MANCAGCGAEIEFVKTPTGNLIPVDLKYIMVITDEGKAVRGRISHFATCPQADRFRKPKPK